MGRVVWALLMMFMCAGIEPVRADERPFAAIETVAQAALSAKWRAAQRRMAEDRAQLAACRAEPWMCSDDERRLEAIVGLGRAREGRARIGEINRAINLAIRPVSDMRRFGITDRWSSPLETLGAGAGDCEDYAILKLLAAREAGIAHEDLQLLIVRDSATRNAHAVAAARLAGRWLILDNRSFALVDLEFTHYRVLAQYGADALRPHYASLDAEAPSHDVM